MGFSRKASDSFSRSIASPKCASAPFFPYATGCIPVWASYRRNLIAADVVGAVVALALATLGLHGGPLHLGMLLGLPLVLVAAKTSGLYDRDHLLIRKMTIHEIPALFQLPPIGGAALMVQPASQQAHTSGVSALAGSMNGSL